MGAAGRRAVVSDEDQLRREAEGRGLAIAGALAGALLQLGGALWRELAFRHAPTGKHKEKESLLFVHHHAAPLIGSSAVTALGAVVMALALRHLFLATRHRRPELPPVALYCAIAGPLLLLAGQVVSTVVLAGKASDFAGMAHQTNAIAKHAFSSGPLKAGAAGVLAGNLAIGFAFVMISLNAMRVGLLTRFMGVLGIIVGVLFVIPIGSPVPVVQAFWLVALAVLFSGRWPSGLPPAWASGRAEPWPSPQQMRERAQAEPEEPAPEPVAAGPAPAGGGGQRRRKRKKRR